MNNTSNENSSSSSSSTLSSSSGQRRQGVVEYFIRVKGFGYIIDSETNEKHYTHFSELNCGPNSFQTLHESQKVEYNLIDTEKGTRCVNVTAPNGEILTGIVSPQTFEIGNRRKGFVRQFSRDKGYGFVIDRETDEEFFAHYTHLICNERSRSLWQGQEVEFEDGIDEAGRRIAVRVSGVGGNPLTQPSWTKRGNNPTTVDQLTDVY